MNKSSIEVTGEIYRSRLAKRKTVYDLYPPFPEDCMVELTNVCNHECVFCTNPRMKRKPAHLSFDLFKKFITEAASLGCKELGFYSTGEPFMTPNLSQFIQVANAVGIPYLYISTNGVFATPERIRQCVDAGLNSIKFSINAATRETYKLVHGKDEFDKVLANVRWIYEYKTKHKPDLCLLGSCVLTRTTEREKKLHQQIFRQYFEDILYVIASNQAGQAEEEAKILVPATHPITYPAEGKAPPCFMLWKRVHLTAEGYLTLCCVDYENNLTYAKVDDGQNLMTHWHNSVITEMRHRQITQELKGTLCHNCLYGGDESYQPISALHSQQTDVPGPRKLQSLKDRLDFIQKRY